MTDEIADAQLSYDERVASGYYIYGLVDPRALRETGGDPLLSVFYVGKGKNDRWAMHERDVLNTLTREELLLERRSSKAERIRMILDRGEQVPAIRLSAGYLDDKDAYYAEALAIDTVGAVLAQAGRPPLTNATPGHHAGFVWLRDHFVFTETVEEELRGEPPTSGLPTAAPTEILVKGTVEELIVPGQRVTDPARLPHDVAAFGARVIALHMLDDAHPETTTRRGWDPLDPWTDLEARDRARRYWPIAPHRVATWLRNPDTMPRSLLLAIPEPGGQTVVRYAWSIDPLGTWEYYPDAGRWGLPLGDRLYEHLRLGRALYDNRDGRRVQVLHGYASGIRVIDS